MRTSLTRLFPILLIGVFFAATASAATVDEVIEIDKVWSGHTVGFSLHTAPPFQYVGYYDAERRMIIAQRRLDGSEWIKQILPERVGWDSHNSIVLTTDDNGDLHVSGNMHCHPLKYFRTGTPGDLSTLAPAKMVGDREDRATYPHFFRGPDDRLIFTYRDGQSGNGVQIYNVYDTDTESWSRLIDQPLADGEGRMNAYLHGPIPGPDGYSHLCWIWRDTPDCATNHDISYARSRDLVSWETGAGKPVTLPMTLATAEVVDPVPPGGGAINGNNRIGFDTEGRVVITYHKYDEKGFTQIYAARLEEGIWKIAKLTDWEYRWEFSGGGSIPFEVYCSPVSVKGNGDLVASWSHAGRKKETWKLDPKTLRPLERVPNARSKTPSKIGRVESDFPGMRVRTASDSGRSGEAGVRWKLRWETLGPNRDRPREKPWPEPSTLKLVRISD